MDEKQSPKKSFLDNLSIIIREFERDTGTEINNIALERVDVTLDSSLSFESIIEKVILSIS